MTRKAFVRTVSVTVLALSLATQQGILEASIDDDVPIRSTAEIAVEEKEDSEDGESTASTDDSKSKVRKVAVQKTETTVKNQVPYRSTQVDPETEMKVYAYFSDIPEMIYVAECESTFRHYGSDGKVLRGRAVSEDVGVMQINEGYHLKRSESLGYDIHTLEGNMEYARHLYEEKGLQPWSASRPCWIKKHSLAQL
ncbi:MAG: hypothetical protein U5L75_01750 [Candidatus Campbellbacteria bacterium]|nr:hypothetical protein [Candidatus Campbellbacteria bacterium]